jgi:biopolymer transport protein ExbB
MFENLLIQYKAGGMTMHLILVIVVLGLWIFLERLMVLKSAGSINKEEVLGLVNSYILQGQIDKAVSACSQIKTPLTNIISVGLIAVKNRKEDDQIQTAMDSVALKEIPNLEKRISLLSTIANLAIVAGLLGTVIGMADAFAIAANAAPMDKASVFATRISMSLNCAGFGLLAAVALLSAYGWLNSWSQSLVDDIHEASVTTLNFILSNKDKILR